MANESTSSTLSELYTEIVAEAEFVIQEKSLEVPIYSAIAAAAVAEATDLSNSAVDPSSVTITASEVGVEICHCPNYKKFGEFLGNLIEAIRSQALNVIHKGLGLVKVQRLGIEETIIYPRVPNYAFA